MRRILAKVDDARLGRAIAGLVTRVLSVEDVVRRDKEICVLVRNRARGVLGNLGCASRGRACTASISRRWRCMSWAGRANFKLASLPAMQDVEQA